MAYATSNPPFVICQGVGGYGKIYRYISDNDVSGTSAGDVGEAAFFTNGYALGMRLGDVVIATDTDSYACQTFAVTTVVTDGAVTVTIQA